MFQHTESKLRVRTKRLLLNTQWLKQDNILSIVTKSGGGGSKCYCPYDTSRLV